MNCFGRTVSNVQQLEAKELRKTPCTPKIQVVDNPIQSIRILEAEDWTGCTYAGQVGEHYGICASTVPSMKIGYRNKVNKRRKANKVAKRSRQINR